MQSDHIETLQLNRSKKMAELEVLFDRSRSLEVALAGLQDATYQVRLIEEALSARYEATRKKFPIDRQLEPEIETVITQKQSAVYAALQMHRSVASNAKSSLSQIMSKIDREEQGKLSLVNCHQYHYWMKQTAAAFEREQEKERKSIRKKAEADRKAAQKECDDTIKVAKKTCVDSLKVLFGELEVDAKRFHKKGISKENLQKIAKLMSHICEEGAKLGTIPASYLPKVYSWEVIAEEIPEDEERKHREQESLPKKKLQDDLRAAKQKVRKLRADLKNTVEHIAKRSQELENQRKTLETCEIQYPIEEERACREEEDALRRLKQVYDRDVAEKKAEATQKDALLADQRREIDQLLEVAQTEEKRWETEMEQLEFQYNKAFVFAFKKKREIKEQYAVAKTQNYYFSTEVKRLQQELSQLKKQNPQITLEYDLQKLEENYKLAVQAAKAQKKKALRKLETDRADLKKKISATEKELEKLQRDQQKCEAEMKTTNKQVDNLTKELADFHDQYLIKTFGKELGITDQLKDKKKEKKNLDAAIKALQYEIADMDKKLATYEQQQAKERAAFRIAQIEKAKEEERLRQEKKALEERVRQQLAEREQEQELLRKKSVAISQLDVVVQELEQDAKHPLLQPELCPLSDDGKRTLTNSIVRKQYTQCAEMSDGVQYVLFFVDHKGRPISDQRIIVGKTVGEQTTTSFELKAPGGFDNKNYYLLMLDFTTGAVICAQRYKINIAFANDFDF